MIEDSISFLFGEDVAAFRSHEFCLISGLRSGEFSHKQKEDESCIRDTYFMGKKKITLKHLEDQFNLCQNEDNIYKLGLLYFVHFVVLGKEKDSYIDYHMLELVDNEYKWGDILGVLHPSNSCYQP